MRLSPAEKQEIIQLVDRSELGVNRTLKELGIHKSTLQMVPGLSQPWPQRTIT